MDWKVVGRDLGRAAAPHLPLADARVPHPYKPGDHIAIRQGSSSRLAAIRYLKGKQAQGRCQNEP